MTETRIYNKHNYYDRESVKNYNLFHLNEMESVSQGFYLFAGIGFVLLSFVVVGMDGVAYFCTYNLV